MSELLRYVKKRRIAHAFLYVMPFVFAALLPVNACAQTEPIPELPEISAAVAKTDPSLLGKRAELVAERNALRDRVDRHNAACSEVEEDSAEEKSCLRAFEDIAAAVDSHIKASKKYLRAYDAAVQAVAARRSRLVAFPDQVPQNLRINDARFLTQTHERLLSMARSLEKRLKECEDVKVGSQEESQCESMSNQLNEEWGSYEEMREKYAKMCDLAILIQRDEQAIRNLNLDKRAEDFEDWATLADAAKKEFERQTGEAIQDAAFAIAEDMLDKGLEKGIDVVGSFNPVKANSLITQLTSYGISDPLFFDAIRKIARIKDKREKAMTAKVFLDDLKKSQEIYELYSLDLRTEDGRWRLGAILLGLGIEDSRLNLLSQLTLQDARFAFYSAHNNIARRVSKSFIIKFTALTEHQLHALRRLSKLLTKHVDEYNTTKQELIALMKN